MLWLMPLMLCIMLLSGCATPYSILQRADQLNYQLCSGKISQQEYNKQYNQLYIQAASYENRQRIFSNMGYGFANAASTLANSPAKPIHKESEYIYPNQFGNYQQQQLYYQQQQAEALEEQNRYLRYGY